MADPIDAFQMGAAALPLAGASTGLLVRVADPALFHLVDFLAWGIERHVGARLIAEATSAGVTGISAAVRHKTYRDPAPLLTSEQAPLPILAGYRKTADMGDHTVTRGREMTKVEVMYVLPALTAGQSERLSPVLVAVSRVVFNFSRWLQHASYTPTGGTAGQNIRTLSGINFCAVRSVRFGDVASFAKGLFMPAVACTLDLSEVETLNETLLTAYAGTDAEGDVQDNATGTAIEAIFDLKTDV